jgi:hypothetical protein
MTARWWTVFPWIDRHGCGLKLGLFTLFAYYGYVGVCVWNRSCYEWRYRR